MKIVESFVHGDKLKALLGNPKLPQGDRANVVKAIDRYESWKKDLARVDGSPSEILSAYVRLLDDYKRMLDLELIFDSESDFLYRQKGQLKLDNTVLEEFLPRLFDERLVPGFKRIQNVLCGPRASFAGLSFDSPLIALAAGGANVKLKDQDFAVTKLHRLTITESPASGDVFSADIAVSYFATEIKTNLDKTMFQEAAQTAGELKRAVSGSKYVLLCEYLDMKPINTKLTPIDEVIVLRKSKRLASNVRENFSTSVGRRKARAKYVEHLDKAAMKVECFARFVSHLNECFPTERADQEDVVLGRGYF